MKKKTGLSGKLKKALEKISGDSLDKVKVHYNTDKPAQLQAHAYAEGTNIHLAPGQEKHLPHEAWHVIQQVQGKVKTTTTKQKKVVNNAAGLEKEADKMGKKQMKAAKNKKP
jgi:cytochrome c oxidase assembly protein Cox11